MSDAVSLARISAVVGYTIETGDFATTSPNLPQRIILLGEANEANQTNLDVSAFQLNSAQQAGARYGYGSPLHMAARILLPANGDGLGGIPLIAIPQAKAVGAAAKILLVVPTGTATDNATHYLVIAGRSGLDNESYSVNIVKGDTPSVIQGKIADAANAILGCPFIVVNDVTGAICTSKWRGKTANKLSIRVDTNNDPAGVTYAVTSSQVGSGTPSIAAALALFGNEWNTLVINSYGTETAIMDTLEDFNGVPDNTNPTGRFQGIIMKPFVAITGTTDEDPSAISDARLNQVTIAFAPAPLSEGLPLEAAANMCLLQATIAQNTPHLDVIYNFYPDMPTPKSIGAMSIYNNRDAMVKKGCSTVDLVAGKYQVIDFVTTYHPVGEKPLQFSYVRDISSIDGNFRYTFQLEIEQKIKGYALAADGDTVVAEKVIKPKDVKQMIYSMTDRLVRRGIIVDGEFTKKGTTVKLGVSNPNRLDNKLPYKRSGVGRILSTSVIAGYNFGTLE